MGRRRIKFKLGEIKIAGVELEIEDEREQATSAIISDLAATPFAAAKIIRFASTPIL